MRADVYKMIYGNYKFTAEMDTGSETGENQLTVWFAEKVDVEHVHLSHFPIDLLLSALQEPIQSRLRTQLEQEKIACQQAFEVQLATLQMPNEEKPAKKLSSKGKRQVRQIRQQMNSAVQRLEADFLKRELMSLDRHCFDLDMLWAASHVFGEARFLRDFYFDEANKRCIKDFCQRFAVDETYRQDVLAGRTHWAKRDALFMRNLLSIGV